MLVGRYTQLLYLGGEVKSRETATNEFCVFMNNVLCRHMIMCRNVVGTVVLTGVGVV